MKKLFLIIGALCLSLALVFGFSACGGNGGNTSVVPVAGIGLNKSSLQLEVGDSEILIATILPANATDKSLNWSSSAPAIASVSGGKVTAVSAGEAKITVKSGGKKAECTVTVTEKDEPPVTIPVNSISLNMTSLDMEIGDYFDLVPAVLPADATNRRVSWTSSSSCVTVSDNGRVTAVSAGIATVTAEADGKRATCDVTVSEKSTENIPVTDVTLSETSLELTAGDTHKLTATVAPADATDKALLWTSDRQTVASVKDGVVTAKAVGTAQITVTAGGKSAVCTVTVKEKPAENIPVTDVTLSETSLDLTAGDTHKLTATVAPADATDKTLTWTSDKQTVASVKDGVVTAKAVGTAKITVTAGGKSAVCTVTVRAKDVPATGITLNENSLELKEGETFTLTATVEPFDTTENDIIWTSSDEAVATVENGVVTAKAEGTAIITARAGNVKAECEIAVIKDGGDEPDVPADSIITYAHAGEECAAFEWKDTNASGAKVEYKLSSASSYTAIDKQLIRESDGIARADVLGLKGGVQYDFKITSGDGKISYVRNVAISSLDRSGYAHHNYTGGVGAYNDDGTLKSNATIVYVTEATKNAVIVDGVQTNKSIAEYLTGAKSNKNPIVVRIIGTVGAATWEKGKVTYTKTDENTDEDGNLLPEAITDKNGNPLAKRDWTQAELDGTYNDLDTSVYAELRGLNSTISWNEGKQEFDSCWNDCQVRNVKNITIEGVGEDAVIFQWGFTFKSCSSVEVRNLTFDDYTEDACSAEGGKSDSSETDPDAFTYKRFWIHHNVFEEGVNYWDVCKEQDKHDGDGSTDFKYISYVTVAYNQYNQTHKTGLVGGDDGVYSASFTFHHNYYNGCSQRMPLGRQANFHIYNNYFYKSGLYSISLRARAYAFVENCVFTSGSKDTKPVEFRDDKNLGIPSAKIIDCLIEGHIKNQFGDEYLYVGNDRQATVDGTNKYGQNFEQADGFYTVTNKLETGEVATKIPALAGVMKRNPNIEIEGGSEEQPPVVDPNPPAENPDPSNKVTMNVGDAVNAGKLQIANEQNFDNVELAEGIIINTSGNRTKVTAHNNTFDGEHSFTHRIVLKGAGNYFAITADKACTVKVYVANGSSTDTTGRRIGLYTDTAGTAVADGTQEIRIVGGQKQVVEYNISEAGTFYLESLDNELSFYQIEIIYNA